MVSNDWVQPPRQPTPEEIAISMLIYEAGIETAGPVGGLFEMQFPMTIKIKTSILGVKMILEAERPLPAFAARSLAAAVKRCKGGPFELVISEPRIVPGSADDPTAIGVHTYSVDNGVIALAMPSDKILGAKT